MSHLAHLATPIEANRWEHVSAWLFAITVDVAMVLAGWALMNNLTPAPVEPQVIERIVEVPVEVEKIVYVERPAVTSVTAGFVEAETVEETETVTRTRTVTSGRRSALTAEQHERVIELIDLKREEIASGVKGVAAEIMRKVELSGHTNVVTRLPEWKAIKG
jgi:hypothetical protein